MTSGSNVTPLGKYIVPALADPAIASRVTAKITFFILSALFRSYTVLQLKMQQMYHKYNQLILKAFNLVQKSTTHNL